MIQLIFLIQIKFYYHIFLSLQKKNFLNADVILSPHYINQKDENKFGRYNGGFLYIKSKKFANWWREETIKNPEYFEQKTLELAYKKFKISEFPIQYNFGWWRFFMVDENTKEQRLKELNIINNKICFQNKPLITIHTHWFIKKNAHGGANMKKFNSIIQSLLEKTNLNFFF